MSRAKKGNAKTVGKYLSGLEKSIAEQLASTDVPHQYEGCRITYTKKTYYVPDFHYPPKPPDVDWSDYEGIIIEAKGWFQGCDRTKHKLLKAQYPNLDVRFVFSNARAKVGRKPKDGAIDRRQTNAEWCEKNGFKYAEKVIPEAWLSEFSQGS